MIDRDDFDELQERFDQRYKKIDDCDREMREATEQHHVLDKRLANCGYCWRHYRARYQGVSGRLIL